MSQYANWCENFIRKNNAMFVANEAFITEWLERVRKNELFFGAKMKLEWQAGKIENPEIWNTIMQFRPSGLRVKSGTYFPALMAMIPRKYARLQSFPDSFQYDEKRPQAYKQFGNAVNVKRVQLFAKFLFGDMDVRRRYTKIVDIRQTLPKRET